MKLLLQLMALAVVVIAVSGCTAYENPATEPPSSPPENPFLTSPESPDQSAAEKASGVSEKTLEEFKAIEEKLFVFDYPVLGEGNAAVTIVYYADFGNTESSQFAFSQFHAIKRDYVVSSKAKVIFRPFPVESSADSEIAAEASLCMAEQGSRQFWAYHDVLFQFASHLDNSSLHNYVSRIPNADKGQFAGCMASRKYVGVVEKTLSQGAKEGIEVVPTLVINGQKISGSKPYDDYKNAIDGSIGKESATIITGNAVSLTTTVKTIWQVITDFIARFR